MKQKLLMTAVASAVALATGAAFASTTGPAGTTAVPKFAQELIASNNTLVNLNSDIEWKVAPTDLVVGRNSSFNLKFNLSGAVFGAAAPAIAPAPWVVSTIGIGNHCDLIAGGAIGDSFATYSCNADNTHPLPADGTVTILDPVLKSTLSSLGAGGSVSVSVDVLDPNTASVLPGGSSGTVATGVTGVKFDVTKNPTMPLIDVSTGSTKFDTGFVSATAGQFTASVDTTVRRPNYTLLVNGDLTGIGIKLAGVDYSAFDVAATGSPTTSLTYLTDAANTCPSSPPGGSTLTPVANATPAAINFPKATATAPAAPALVAANAYKVCLVADGVTSISEGTPTAAFYQATLAGVEFTPSLQGNLADLKKNGFSAYFPTVAFGTVNPTYLRIANNSSVSGSVFVTVRSDTGAVLGTANISVGTIAANAVMLKSMGDLLGTAVPASGLGSIQVNTTLPAGTTKAQVFWVNLATGVVTSATSSQTNAGPGSN